MSLPASSRPPGPTAMISPCDGFSCAVSGMMMPPADFASASIRSTTTRSCSGRNFIRDLLRLLNVFEFRRELRRGLDSGLEHLGACPRYGRVGRSRSWHGRPSALLDERASIPLVAEFVEVAEIARGVR